MMIVLLFSDAVVAELELSNGGRYKPEGLDQLCKNTNFTKKELQIMYRGFKQVILHPISFFCCTNFKLDLL